MQSSLALGQTLAMQHRLLKGKCGLLMAVPLQCASYHIEMGFLEKAVESLERGQALLWSEMRGLRMPIDQLRESDNATLAERYVAISQELEDTTTFGEAPETDPRDHIPQGRSPTP